MKYDSNQQRTVVRCFAGCDNELVLESLGLQVKDMFDRKLSRTTPGRARTPRPRTRPVSRAERALTAAGMPTVQPKKPERGEQTSPWKTTATYAYMREDGTVAGEVVRREAGFAHGRDKEFHQKRWNPETGRMENGGFDPLPYQLPQVLEQVRSGGVVYVCEGEKDVHAAESAGLVATTNAGGAAVWSSAHAKWLEGAQTVVVVADADPAGYRRAERVVDTLSGLVGRVRVVRPATGKDLFDHLQCGHEVGELEPIPYLDPYTRPPAPAQSAPGGARAADQETTTEIPAAEAEKVSVAVSTPEGDPQMGKYMMAPDLDDRAPHSDEVDHISGSWARVMQALLNHLLQVAVRKAAQRVEDALIMAQREEDERRAAQERLDAERAAVEARLAAMEKNGWGNASREELADAVVQARAWAPDSAAATQSWYRLRSHIMGEYGIFIGDEDQVEFNGNPAELSAAIASRQAEKVTDLRARRAHDRMVATIAAQEGLDESVKQGLYAEVRQWSQTPSAATLDELSKKLVAAKVPDKTCTEIRFIGVYLSTQAPVTDPGRTTSAASLTSTHLLRKLDAPLVDPGEEIKPRIDQLLVSYQDQLRAGHVTDLIQARLASAVRLLTPEEQTAVRERGEAIRREPTKAFAAMFPDHVDRDELAGTVQLYAALRPQADRAVVTAGDYDAGDATALRVRADKARKKIQTAIRNGKGLHQLERDQLEMVLADVDAGKIPPQMVFIDDRSAAAADADRADGIARESARQTRKEALEMLSGAGVDPAAARSVRDDVVRVAEDHVHLAAGRISLHDYGDMGRPDTLHAAMAGAGIPTGVRNRVSNHLDKKASDAAITGKQASRIADRWAERTEAVAASRGPAPTPPAYDSAHRRLEREVRLKSLGLTDDQIAQHMAADTGHAHPPSAAVRNAPSHNGTRVNPIGTGVQRTHHRGRGEQGIGR
ncbi:toprim domain-containing protein [Nocardia grenadensis]